jgi:hypothetical protein
LEPMTECLPDLADVCFIDIETTGLDPHREKIITIQARHGGETKVWKEWELGEARCLRHLFRLLSEPGARSKSFVGYNVLKFDVPFIDVRLRENGLMEETVWHLLHDQHYVDLYQLLGDYYAKASRWYLSMTTVKNETVNAEIPELYATGAYSLIEEYVGKEMEAMEALYEETKRETFYAELTKLRGVTLRE